MGPTNYCVVFATIPQLSIAAILPGAVFDILVCIAITYRLGQDNISTEGHVGWRRWGVLTRRNVQYFTERFLQDSQLYLFITIWAKVPEIVIGIVYASRGPSSAAVQVALSFPDTVLVNAMVARVYRSLKLGRPGILAGQRTETTPISHPPVFRKTLRVNTDSITLDDLRDPQSNGLTSQISDNLPRFMRSEKGDV
jgi:TRAP-type C4-dicarboxylate transport system permease large subunit